MNEAKKLELERLRAEIAQMQSRLAILQSREDELLVALAPPPRPQAPARTVYAE